MSSRAPTSIPPSANAPSSPTASPAAPDVRRITCAEPAPWSNPAITRSAPRRLPKLRTRPLAARADPDPGGESSELAAARPNLKRWRPRPNVKRWRPRPNPKRWRPRPNPKRWRPRPNPKRWRPRPNPKRWRPRPNPKRWRPRPNPKRWRRSRRQTGTSLPPTPLSPKPTLPALPDPRGWAFPSPIRRCARDQVRHRASPLGQIPSHWFLVHPHARRW